MRNNELTPLEDMISMNPTEYAAQLIASEKKITELTSDLSSTKAKLEETRKANAFMQDALIKISHMLPVDHPARELSDEAHFNENVARAGEEWNRLNSANFHLDVALQQAEKERDDTKAKLQQLEEDIELLKLTYIDLMETVETLETEIEGLRRDRESLIQCLINYAGQSADFMEGEGEPQFSIYEDQMCWAIGALKNHGVKYDPMSGTRTDTAAMKETK